MARQEGKLRWPSLIGQHGRPCWPMTVIDYAFYLLTRRGRLEWLAEVERIAGIAALLGVHELERDTRTVSGRVAATEL